MAAPEPPNFNRYTGLDANVPVKPPETTITYPTDLGTIQTINGVSYGVQITAYKYTSQTFTDFLTGSLSGVGVSILAAGVLTGTISLRFLASIGIPSAVLSSSDFTRPNVGESEEQRNQRQQRIEDAIRNNLQNRQISNSLGNPLGTVNLQLPVKINDAHTLTWSQESAKSIFDFTGLIRLTDVVGAQFGVTVNPALFMMFHHPNFKTIDMTWQFAAHNEQESFAIANIINFFKYHSAPERNSVNLNYPSMFAIKLFPNNLFTFRLKPCIIEAVVTDFTPAGYPSFNRNGAPVSINMKILFKEIDIWTKDTWERSV